MTLDARGVGQARMIAEALRGGAGPAAQQSIVDALAEAEAARGTDVEAPHVAAEKAGRMEVLLSGETIAGSGPDGSANRVAAAAAPEIESTSSGVDRRTGSAEGGAGKGDGEGRGPAVEVDPALVQKFLQTKEESLKLLLEDFGGQVQVGKYM